MPRYNSLFERLVANSHKPDDQNENGCWLWTGTTDGKRWPYGKVNVRIDGKHTSLRAHRAMAQLFEEKPLDPEHETVEHLCGNPLCVNPDHFELIDRVDNSLRSIMEKPRGIWNGR
jgi:hypothetical protein